MALVAPVQNGEVIQKTSTVSEKQNGKIKPSGTLDKDAFLGLLVAQMKYQDPMEPTSNTEYISQYAQFSELEEMQNLGTTMDLQRGSSLVGKNVIMKTTTQTGDIQYVQGKVDYVINENSKVFLSINGSSYPLDELDSIVDDTYLNAITLADDFTKSLNKLPNVDGLTLEYKSVIDNLSSVYRDMNDYERGYLSKETIDKFESYVERMNQLVKASEADKQ